MSDWNTDQYLRFKAQRTQPAIDLARRLEAHPFARIADLGCGPGNSTGVLRQIFPRAEIVGIDNSPGMLEKARAAYPELTFLLQDIHQLAGDFDLIFSNACLQWLPRHEDLLPELMAKLPAGGALAVQMPGNGGEPLFRIIRETAEEPRWGFRPETFGANDTLEPDRYFDILSRCSAAFDLWETVYRHPMPGHEALVDWVRGSRLRPYLDALDEASGRAFEAEILEKVRAAYPVMANGQVVLRFRRIFFTAWK